MRYRPEKLPNEELVIRNVETDVLLATVVPLGVLDPCHPDRQNITACQILYREEKEIFTLGPFSGPTIPLDKVATAVASHEKCSGYPCFKRVAKNPEPRRIEFRLGTLLADAASTIARAVIEHSNGGLKAKTKRKWVKLVVELHAIWYVSRFGSFNAERAMNEPYFANVATPRPRMSFAEAAQAYGMFELRMRYPDESDEFLKQALALPLDLLERTLDLSWRDRTASRVVN